MKDLSARGSKRRLLLRPLAGLSSAVLFLLVFAVLFLRRPQLPPIGLLSGASYEDVTVEPIGPDAFSERRYVILKGLDATLKQADLELKSGKGR